MMIGVLAEALPEKRVPLLPASVKKIKSLGANVQVQTGLGASLGIKDSEYADQGADIVSSLDQLLKTSEVLVGINAPGLNLLEGRATEALHISFLDPFDNRSLIDGLNQKRLSSIGLEMIPRITRAQKMDVLSSQASLAGYAAVVLAAQRLKTVFPMMMTPAGTISPSKIFIIGAGVAGLQAIATAKRLGARVEAFDTRPVVEEQVKSLGAKFVKVDLGETGQTKDGYAKALTQEQLDKQRQVMAKHIAEADAVITTAQVFGRKAPIIVTDDMLQGMSPGSVVIDLAASTGGNVEGISPGESIIKYGVELIGYTDFPGRVAYHSSQMLSANITFLIEELIDSESKKLNLDLENDVIKGSLVTHHGELVHPMVLKAYQKGNSP